MPRVTLKAIQDYTVDGIKFVRDEMHHVNEELAGYLEKTGLFEVLRGGVKIRRKSDAPEATDAAEPAEQTVDTAGTSEAAVDV